jgi:hypothetical protein
MDEISVSLTTRPVIDLGASVYSNYDHEIDNKVVFELQAGDCFAFHAAWEYCGCVWFVPASRKWVEQVERYTVTLEYIIGDTVEEVIKQTIDKYGDA